MASEIVMPPLSQTTDEVTLVGWLVKEGDTINKGDPVCEVETDKVSMEVESFTSGTVLKILAEPDTVIRAGTVIALVGAEGEVPELPKVVETASSESAQPSPPSGEVKLSPVARDMASKQGLKPDRVTGTGLGGTVTSRDLAGTGGGSPPNVKATSIVRHLAQKHGVNLGNVAGTGPQGLITVEDLDRFRAGGAAGVTAPGTESVVPLTGNQQAIALNISRSSSETPQFYLKTTVYMEQVISYRAAHLKPEGGRVSMTALLVKAAAAALARHPRLNGYYQDSAVHLYGSIGIAVAVASGDELYVPVVHDPNSRDIRDIDKDISWLAAKARNGKLEAGDLKGGTFTVSNMGMYPVDEFSAIISPKQAGILAVGRMEKKLVIDENNGMRIRPAVTITGSFDHRVVNGAQGAEFLGTLKSIIEEEM